MSMLESGRRRGPVALPAVAAVTAGSLVAALGLASAPAGAGTATERVASSVARSVGTAWIEGVVLGPDGSALDDVLVQALSSDGEAFATALTYASDQPGGPMHGYFYLQVPAETYLLTLTHPDIEPLQVGGVRARDGTIETQAPLADPVITGVVLSPAGVPMDDVTVQAVNGKGKVKATSLTYASAKFDEPQHGYFSLQVPSEGTYDVVVTDDTMRDRTVRDVEAVKGEETDLGEIAGRVGAIQLVAEVSATLRKRVVKVRQAPQVRPRLEVLAEVPDVFAGDIAVEGRLLKRAGVKLTSAAVKGWVKKSLRLDAAAGDVLQESRPTTVRLPSFKRVVGKRLNRKERKQTIQVKGVGKVAVDTVPVVLDAGLAERWGVDVYDWPVSDDLVTDGVRLTAVLKR